MYPLTKVFFFNTSCCLASITTISIISNRGQSAFSWWHSHPSKNTRGDYIDTVQGGYCQWTSMWY